MEENKRINDFFEDMKRADTGIEIPEYNSLIKTRKWHFGWVAAAASLILIAFSAWYILTGTQEPASIEIVVMEESPEGSFSLMSHDLTIEEWKSPTQSLIDDF